MNKIFKVLWNKVRSTNVVTDETKTAHGKGRQGVLSEVSSGTAGVLLSAAALFLLGASGPLRAASTITAGRDKTHVTSSGGVHDITTDAVKNSVGVNKFEKFEVVANEIANLQFGSADKLLNFVNDRVTVNGTVNAIKNNKIGGDLYFIP